jgi:aspartate aminotransferase-like enzyme
METLNKATMEEMLSTPNRLLVGAGPGNLDPWVVRALTLPLLSHLDPTFWEIMDSMADLLRRVFRTENEATSFSRRREWPGWRPVRQPHRPWRQGPHRTLLLMDAVTSLGGWTSA